MLADVIVNVLAFLIGVCAGMDLEERRRKRLERRRKLGDQAAALGRRDREASRQ